MALVCRAVYVLVLGLVLSLVVLSLGTLSIFSSFLIQILISGAVVLWFLRHALKFEFFHLDAIGFLLGALLAWLLIQSSGQELGLTYFEIPAPFWKRLDLFFMFFVACGIFILTAEAFSSRGFLVFFLQFYCLVSSIFALYFIFVFFSSGKPVEQLAGSFTLLSYLGPLSVNDLQPNNTVDLFYPGAFFSLAFLIYASSKGPKFGADGSKTSEIAIALLCTCLQFGAVLMTQSRAGIMAFIVGAVIFFGLVFGAKSGKKAKVNLFLFALIFFAFLILFLDLKDVVRELSTVSNEITSETKELGTRAATIGASFELVRNHGFLGVGLGNFHMGWLLYHQPPFYELPLRSYNDFLWIWAEVGAPGIALLMLAFLFFMITMLRSMVETESHFVSFFSIAALSIIVAFLVHSIVDPTFYVKSLFYQMCFVMGVGIACRRSAQSEVTSEQVGVVRGFFSMVMTFLLLCLAASSLYFGVRKFSAYQLTLKADNVQTAIRAIEMDPDSKWPLVNLSNYYQKDYLEDPTDQKLEILVRTIDQILLRDPFDLTQVWRRAKIYLDKRDKAGVISSFDRMQDVLPDYYELEFMASVFFMNASQDESYEGVHGGFEALSLQYLRQAIKHNPNLDVRGVSRWATPAGVKRYYEIFREQDLLP